MSYTHKEDVFGAITPTVDEVEFTHFTEDKVTEEQQTKLAQALVAANVFDQIGEKNPGLYEYLDILDVRIGEREGHYAFYSPPDTPTRKTVQAIMLQFAKDMKSDRPDDPIASKLTTEGDSQPAKEVSLAEVLAHPETYHGTRISVTGFYRGEFESSSFSIDREASDRRDYSQSVWLGGISTFAEKSDIRDRNESWLRIEGVFLSNSGGHMGLWPGEIARLTKIEPILPPNEKRHVKMPRNEYDSGGIGAAKK